MTDLIVVAWVRLPHEAQMIKDRLAAEDIPCLVTGEKTVSTVGPINELNITWGNPLGGIMVRVPSEFEKAARASLQNIDAERVDNDGAECEYSDEV